MSRRQKGFTLLELLVAMMILAVLGTLGFQQIRKHTAAARYLKAKDDMQVISDGLAQYYLKHAKYPDFSNFGAMVDANSPLVKESLIKTNMSADDPFGQPYQGQSNSHTYTLTCQGDPNDAEDHGPFTLTPDQGLSSGAAPSAPAGAASDKGPSAAPAGKGK
ncbi:MAG: type II secretion system protein [Acidobacteria bacterium]|nr:type II secretion system protein [Acidobacteriota bacterium]